MNRIARSKKLFSLLFSAILFFSLLPSATVFAAGTPTRLNINAGSIVIGSSGASGGGLASSETTLNPAGYYITGGAKTANTIAVQVSTLLTLDDTFIETRDCAFAIKQGASVTLTLSGKSTIKSGKNRAGLEVPKGAALSVAGEGTLEVTGGENGAGVGGGNGSASGTITINCIGTNEGRSTDGTWIDREYNIRAIGGTNGAGIGGGNKGSGGTFTISSGNVRATGGDNGAGIGGGNGGAGGTVTIRDVSGSGLGCAVSAFSYKNGAGIGGGNRGSGGRITISSGRVGAYGLGGAGIGGGYRGAGGRITISGGTITSNSNANGAGIGGGYEGAGGTVTISGGTISPSSVAGSCIGGGKNGKGGTVIISGGTVLNTFADKGINCMKRTGSAVITGGSVFCAVTPQPVNSESEAVYPALLSGLPSNGKISAFSLSKEGREYAYGAPAAADYEGYLCLHLPIGSYTVQCNAEGYIYQLKFSVSEEM